MKSFCNSFYFALLFLFLFQQTANGKTLSFDDCGSDGSKITDLEMHPDFPRPGNWLHFTSKLTTKNTLNGGVMTVRITKKIFRRTIPMYGSRTNICSLLTKDDKCPIKANTPYNLEYSVYVPPFTPPGDYDVYVRYFTDSGKQIICYKTIFPFHPRIVLSVETHSAT